MVVTATLAGGSLMDHASSDQIHAKMFTQSSIVDDRGAYRIIGLPPGTYRLSTRLRESFLNVKSYSPDHVEVTSERAGTANLTVYAPDTWKSSEAKLVRVVDGGEIADADITIPTAKLHSIDGVVTRNGVLAERVSVSLKDGTQQQDFSGDAVSMPDGTFRFNWLPPGSYTLTAIPLKDSPGDADGLGQVHVQVLDRDVFDVDIDLKAQQQRSK